MKNSISHINSVLLALALAISFYLVWGNDLTIVYQVLIVVLVSFFIFNLAIRKNIRFEKYFTSRFNFFTSKFRYQQEFDFTKQLLLEKLVEVIKEAGFSIVCADKTNGKILAVTQISWFSWGENLYINLSENGNKTNVDFCSATIFQLVSWGKNEHNHQKLVDQFENSLVI